MKNKFSIAGDIFAEAILEDLAPRIEPQDIQLGDDELSEAQPNTDNVEESTSDEAQESANNEETEEVPEKLQETQEEQQKGKSRK